MDDLLVNLAALRAEFNQNDNDLVKQFMPLVGYAIGQIQGEIVSEAEIQNIIYNTMQFRVPYGAIRVFINRATNRRYNYLIKNGDGTYSPNRTVIQSIKFRERRNEAQRHQTALTDSFKRYSTINFSTKLDDDDINKYFFEILFDIAPKVMRSLADPIRFRLDVDSEGDGEESIRYRIYKFVGNAVDLDSPDLQYIEEFIQGAVMAESFFYSTPDHVLHKMQDVYVFFDTSLLISAIGLAEEAEVAATRELIDLLKILKAKVRCFRDTRNELHGILYAISKSKESGYGYSRRPGDIGDILNRNGYDLSDIQILLDSLDDRLMDSGIAIEERPLITEYMDVSIAESDITQKLTDEFTKYSQSSESLLSVDRRVKHDVDCLRATFQYRGNKTRLSIERCNAIFITANAGLMRVANEYFTRFLQENNEQDSAVPVCMSSNVFTMLMWLKATNRKSNITKDRLVANSIAALTPSAQLWSAFTQNLKKLLDKGEITREEFDYISNALETRTILMADTEGDSDAITVGTTLEIKNKVMHKLLGGKDEIIFSKETEIANLRQAVADFANDQIVARNRVDQAMRKIQKLAEIALWRFFQFAISIPFLIIFLLNSIDGYRRSGLKGFGVEDAILFIVMVITVFALFVVSPWKRKMRAISNGIAKKIENYLLQDPGTED